METRQQPTPSHQPMPTSPLPARPAVESKHEVLVRVLVLNERDEEEKEAGYGHGV